MKLACFKLLKKFLAVDRVTESGNCLSKLIWKFRLPL